MSIASATLQHDVLLWLRDKLISSLTDPVSRTGNEKFVMTSWPERPVRYPVVILEIIGESSKPLGVGVEASNVTLRVRIHVFSKSTAQRDAIADEIFRKLEQTQLDITGSALAGLHDFKLLNSFNQDEAGEGGLHRKIIDVSYTFNTTQG